MYISPDSGKFRSECDECRCNEKNAQFRRGDNDHIRRSIGQLLRVFAETMVSNKQKVILHFSNLHFNITKFRIEWLADDYSKAIAAMREKLWRSSEPSNFGFVGELLGGSTYSPKMVRTDGKCSWQKYFAFRIISSAGLAERWR